jgi:rubredoxin
MVCPVCGSQAVVADTNVPDAVEKLQTGTDPYELIAGPDAKSRCLSCNHVFCPDEADQDAQ